MGFDPALRQIISSFRASPAWDEELDLRLLQALWPRIAGDSLARSTSVAAIDGDVVVVRVPDATWQQQLQSIRPLLVKRMNEPWPRSWIRDVRLTYEDHDR